jgi:hypothetical protein
MVRRDWVEAKIGHEVPQDVARIEGHVYSSEGSRRPSMAASSRRAVPS